jgi:hypothetical protein
VSEGETILKRTSRFVFSDSELTASGETVHRCGGPSPPYKKGDRRHLSHRGRVLKVCVLPSQENIVKGSD